MLTIILLAAGCSSTRNMSNQAKGVAIGAGSGAVSGGVIGRAADNTGLGAIIGAGVGGVTGGVIGRRMDKQEQELRQIEGVEVSRPSEGEISVRLTNDILFDYDSAALAHPLTRSLMARVDFRHGGSEYDAKYPDGLPTLLEIEHARLRRADHQVARMVIAVHVDARLRQGVGEEQVEGMAQSVGYGIASLGPLLFGALHDVSHS